MDHLPKYKLIVIGDVNCGKTSLIRCLLRPDQSHKVSTPTIGVDFAVYRSSTCALHCWDVSGDPRFHNLIGMYSRDTDVILLLYDLTNSHAFGSIQKYWLPFLEDHPNTPVFLVGNKSDLVSSSNILQIQCERLASESGYHHHIVSSKTGCNVKALFDDIIKEVQDRDPKHNRSTLDLTSSDTSKMKSCAC